MTTSQSLVSPSFDLELVVARLQQELRGYREREETLGVVLRTRAPETDGLTTPGAVKVVLDTRDRHARTTEELRNTFRDLLGILTRDRTPSQESLRQACDLVRKVVYSKDR